MASRPASIADVPARSVPVKSSVRAAGGRSSTAAIVAAACFSAQGEVVVAKYTASAGGPSTPSPSAAFTASVRLSSSWLATAFSPPAAVAPHSRAITSRGSR